MFEIKKTLYLYVETPLHAGSGSSVGLVDLPIQRERITNYPMIQGSGLKGPLRAEAGKASQVNIIFGSDTSSEYAGALSVGDANLLLFPVRSLYGVFAWVTSCNILARYKRHLEATGVSPTWELPDTPATGRAKITKGSQIVKNQNMVLEEFAYTGEECPKTIQLAEKLAADVLPLGEEYTYFRQKLPKSLVILPEDDLRDFTQFSTEVITRTKIDQTTKSVSPGALWTEEHLPSETVMYAPLNASRSRDKDASLDATGVMQFLSEMNLKRIQLGGDATIGRGIVCLRFPDVGEGK